MIDAHQFSLLMSRVRSGDSDAAGELIRQYEPLIRREVRMRLADQRLRRTLDSLDVCQSVLAGFFLSANLQDYEFDDPKQLIRLLVSMTKNKVASAARREYRQKRDRRRMEADDGNLLAAEAAQATPSQIVADNELLERARAMLPDDERVVADMRGQGHTWEEVAAETGGTAHNCRVKFGRAVKRVMSKLGIADEGDDDA